MFQHIPKSEVSDVVSTADGGKDNDMQWSAAEEDDWVSVVAVREFNRQKSFGLTDKDARNKVAEYLLINPKYEVNACLARGYEIIANSKTDDKFSVSWLSAQAFIEREGVLDVIKGLKMNDVREFVAENSVAKGTTARQVVEYKLNLKPYQRVQLVGSSRVRKNAKVADNGRKTESSNSKSDYVKERNSFMLKMFNRLTEQKGFSKTAAEAKLAKEFDIPEVTVNANLREERRRVNGKSKRFTQAMHRALDVCDGLSCEEANELGLDELAKSARVGLTTIWRALHPPKGKWDPDKKLVPPKASSNRNKTAKVVPDAPVARLPKEQVRKLEVFGADFIRVDGKNIRVGKKARLEIRGRTRPEVEEIEMRESRKRW